MNISGRGFSDRARFEVINMANFNELLQEVKNLTYDEKRRLYKALLQQIAIPLQDPKEQYDDWDEVEVDKAYAEIW